MISPSDWVLIGCTITLAVVALTAPYLNDLWKRKSLAPKLSIVFRKESPYILESSDRLNAGFLVCFEVKNVGNSKAKNCEVAIEEFCYKNEKGNIIKENKNIPAKLIWIHSDYSQIDILPNAGRFFRLFHTYNPNKDKLFFEMEMDETIPYSMGLIREELSYLKIKIVLYSENSKKIEQYIEIKSPGIIGKDKEKILQDMQITLS